jgi:hypothetical protein
LEFAKVWTVGAAHVRVLGLKPKCGKHGGVGLGECACEVFHGAGMGFAATPVKRRRSCPLA